MVEQACLIARIMNWEVTSSQYLQAVQSLVLKDNINAIMVVREFARTFSFIACACNFTPAQFSRCLFVFSQRMIIQEITTTLSVPLTVPFCNLCFFLMTQAIWGEVRGVTGGEEWIATWSNTGEWVVMDQYKSFTPFKKTLSTMFMETSKFSWTSTDIVTCA